jgi:adenylosuccinate lyase
MRVYPERMRRNVDALGGLMLSEAVMFALGERIGRVSAHDVVYDAAMRAVESGRAFADLLAADERVSAHLSRAEIAALLEPTRYTGQCGAFVDLVVMQYPAS